MGLRSGALRRGHAGHDARHMPHSARANLGRNHEGNLARMCVKGADRVRRGPWTWSVHCSGDHRMSSPRLRARSPPSRACERAAKARRASSGPCCAASSRLPGRHAGEACLCAGCAVAGCPWCFVSAPRIRVLRVLSSCHRASTHRSSLDRDTVGSPITVSPALGRGALLGNPHDRRALAGPGEGLRSRVQRAGRATAGRAGPRAIVGQAGPEAARRRGQRCVCDVVIAARRSENRVGARRRRTCALTSRGRLWIF
ncbi:uncharacterized protein SOCEGT47_031900 [Sorangium cellulosum]|uniref:Uncharacterized protein n=1 Tax=Sorangium cellulosum TaxID=56 RepID=A0A4P2Q0F5_SORCE|nr:uncharacterized protein SOCEGT47_031900 [Sorangium cellulosum]